MWKQIFQRHHFIVTILHIFFICRKSLQTVIDFCSEINITDKRVRTFLRKSTSMNHFMAYCGPSSYVGQPGRNDRELCKKSCQIPTHKDLTKFVVTFRCIFKSEFFRCPQEKVNSCTDNKLNKKKMREIFSKYTMSFNFYRTQFVRKREAIILSLRP